MTTKVITQQAETKAKNICVRVLAIRKHYNNVEQLEKAIRLNGVNDSDLLKSTLTDASKTIPEIVNEEYSMLGLALKQLTPSITQQTALSVISILLSDMEEKHTQLENSLEELNVINRA
ncbi:MAG: hypothetical protein N4A71_21895 [Carboxylicivirga sp.]|jgi:tRNA G37 N-methylase Trm5|nr:hypothetical protein [Carboxylicivirga sp.]